ncbi:MAG: hypothetical protein LBU91_01760 [Bacteroidales bacterium]|jgi:hypothetical protein|nr:hypothetical protein [Bacteroidales bacterium]
MATPQVEGVIALMYAVMSQSMIREHKNNPSNFALSVKRNLLDGADRIPSLNGLVASGRLNAYAAVKSVMSTISGPTGPNVLCSGSTATYSLDGLPNKAIVLSR